MTKYLVSIYEGDNRWSCYMTDVDKSREEVMAEWEAANNKPMKTWILSEVFAMDLKEDYKRDVID